MRLASLRAVVDVVTAARGSATRFVVGVTGPPGAGKSTVSESLVTMLGSAAALLPMDGFHLPQSALHDLGRRERMGAPDTFDVDGFVATLAALREPGTVSVPGFDRALEEAVPGAITLDASVSTVIVDGNYLLLDTGGWEHTADHLDLVFFVDVDRGIRISRLIERHVCFGKSPADARAWALGPDESNAMLIEATAARADHLIALDEKPVAAVSQNYN